MIGYNIDSFQSMIGGQCKGLFFLFLKIFFHLFKNSLLSWSWRKIFNWDNPMRILLLIY